MFPIQRLEKIHEELYHYYLQIITFQNENPQYQHIAIKFSRNISELDEIIESIRMYNTYCKNNSLLHVFK